LKDIGKITQVFPVALISLYTLLFLFPNELRFDSTILEALLWVCSLVSFLFFYRQWNFLATLSFAAVIALGILKEFSTMLDCWMHKTVLIMYFLSLIIVSGIKNK